MLVQAQSPSTSPFPDGNGTESKFGNVPAALGGDQAEGAVAGHLFHDLIFRDGRDDDAGADH